MKEGIQIQFKKLKEDRRCDVDINFKKGELERMMIKQEKKKKLAKKKAKKGVGEEKEEDSMKEAEELQILDLTMAFFSKNNYFELRIELKYN